MEIFQTLFCLFHFTLCILHLGTGWSVSCLTFVTHLVHHQCQIAAQHGAGHVITTNWHGCIATNGNMVFSVKENLLIIHNLTTHLVFRSSKIQNLFYIIIHWTLMFWPQHIRGSYKKIDKRFFHFKMQFILNIDNYQNQKIDASFLLLKWRFWKILRLGFK